MGKDKKKESEMQVESQKEATEVSYEEKLKSVNVISVPMASKKVSKKLYKIVKKATKLKAMKRGIKEVVKALRKGATGIVAIAGDISPIDVISHLPILCEESGVPYVYVPSKQDLGSSGSTKRPTSCVLIQMHAKDEEFKSNYDELFSEVKALH